MTFEEFQAFIDSQDAFFKSIKREHEDRTRVFSRTIKIGEEYGELCDAVLASVGDQRKDKLSNGHELEGEFADVVITTFLLAKAMNVNMQEALANKIEKIRKKHNKEL